MNSLNSMNGMHGMDGRNGMNGMNGMNSARSMSRILPVYRMHAGDTFTWVGIPAIIMMISFLINWVISLLMEQELYTGGYFSIFIYMILNGIIVISQSFPLVLGLSTTRKDYFWGTVLASVGNAALLALGLTVLALLESETGNWGTGLHFFLLPYWHDGNVFANFGMALLFLLLMFYIGFIISSVFRRFGSISLLLSFLVAALGMAAIGFIVQRFEVWGPILDWFAATSAFELALWTVPLTLLLAGSSYVLLRKASA